MRNWPARPLFDHESRRVALTRDGETVLTYAKSILRLHDELLSQLASPSIEGHVTLGTPDLYAAFLLPSILSVFRRAFPRIQVELNCSLSTPLVGLVKRGEVDVALVTRMNDFTGGQVVGQEQLVWMAGERSNAPHRNPGPARPAAARQHLPRPRHRQAEAGAAALARRVPERERRRPSGGGVFAGMAVTVLGRSALVSNMRELTPEEGFPALPKIDLLLYRSHNANSKAAHALHDYLAHYLAYAE